MIINETMKTDSPTLKELSKIANKIEILEDAGKNVQSIYQNITYHIELRRTTGDTGNTGNTEEITPVLNIQETGNLYQGVTYTIKLVSGKFQIQKNVHIYNYGGTMDIDLGNPNANRVIADEFDKDVRDVRRVKKSVFWYSKEP